MQLAANLHVSRQHARGESCQNQQPLLTIIIPAYNEEHRLPRSLEQIVAFIQAQPEAMEVLVVENGSRDRTTEIAEGFAARYPFIRVLHSEKGKGAAVKAGMMAGSGRYLFICDSDLSMPIAEVRKFLPPRPGRLRRRHRLAGRAGRASLRRAGLPPPDGARIQPDRARVGDPRLPGYPVRLQELSPRRWARKSSLSRP